MMQSETTPNDAFPLDTMLPRVEGVGEGGPDDPDSVSKRRLREVLAALLIPERTESLEILPSARLRADGSHIENQDFMFVPCPDGSGWKMYFKLRAEHAAELQARLEEMLRSQNSELGSVTRDVFSYVDYAVSNSWRIQHDSGIIIEYPNQEVCEARARSLLGLVCITVPVHNGTPDDAAPSLEYVPHVMDELLQVPEGLTPPDPEAERAWMRARYAWHHKIAEKDVPEKALEHLSIVEVSPDYTTVIDHDRHHEYQQVAPHVLFHEVLRRKTIPSFLACGGLLSTHERFRRKSCHAESVSALGDMKSGGADSVFARVTWLDDLFVDDVERMGPSNFTGIIFKPEVLDRTDWYAYTWDRYGTTKREALATRPSPLQFFQKIVDPKESTTNNELMFRCGIGVESVQAIVVPSQDDKDQLLETLRDRGILELCGVPIESFVRVPKTHMDVAAIAGGRAGDLAESYTKLVPVGKSIQRVQDFAASMHKLFLRMRLPTRIKSEQEDVMMMGVATNYVSDFLAEYKKVQAICTGLASGNQPIPDALYTWSEVACEESEALVRVTDALIQGYFETISAARANTLTWPDTMNSVNATVEAAKESITKLQTELPDIVAFLKTNLPIRKSAAPRK